MEYKEDENFHYLVIESCQDEYYGFNLNIKKERSYATKIVSQQNKGNFATRTTTKIWHFLNGILNRKDIDKSPQ